ncbi:hypothetical protein QE331_gp194 [Pseudomonas phage 20Sep416]|uniref:Uncharacterized protein n=1 Tax=Pseudomonas phage 20Sep416 TaxID=3028488 RepID=A0AAF0JID8_9CAUD|nr:hypothetical protein QE331_gp194 [Pseudomonas phage 20Sep416]WFG37613.1 hypothetical protein 20Sep416_00122 [Pseudomonas phage 20Sep416]
MAGLWRPNSERARGRDEGSAAFRPPRRYKSYHEGLTNKKFMII